MAYRATITYGDGTETKRKYGLSHMAKYIRMVQASDKRLRNVTPILPFLIDMAFCDAAAAHTSTIKRILIEEKVI